MYLEFAFPYVNLCTVCNYFFGLEFFMTLRNKPQQSPSFTFVGLPYPVLFQTTSASFFVSYSKWLMLKPTEAGSIVRCLKDNKRMKQFFQFNLIRMPRCSFPVLAGVLWVLSENRIRKLKTLVTTIRVSRANF